MSVMMAEPLPSTLIEFSSAVGVKPKMITSFAPGCDDPVSPRSVWEKPTAYL